MIVHFLVNIQIIELLLAAQSCKKVELVQFDSLMYKDLGTYPLGKYLNTYDSSLSCEESFLTTTFIFSVAYCVFWCLLLPMYTLKKAWRMYLIEAFGMIAKILLLAIAKVLTKINET